MIFEWLFGKRKQKKYATATLVENVVLKDSTKTSPLRSEKEIYIKYLTKLKQAIICRDEKMESFIADKYLSSKGLTVPRTLSGCDELIGLIENWR